MTDRPAAGAVGPSMTGGSGQMGQTPTAEVRSMKARHRVPAVRGGRPDDFAANGIGCDRILVAAPPDETENHPRQTGNYFFVGRRGLSARVAAQAELGC